MQLQLQLLPKGVQITSMTINWWRVQLSINEFFICLAWNPHVEEAAPTKICGEEWQSVEIIEHNNRDLY